jgi:hypothetical protein
VVSVLAVKLKGCGFEPGQGDGFLRAIKIRSTPSSQMGSKAGRSDFTACKRTFEVPQGQIDKILISLPISYFSRGLW